MVVAALAQTHFTWLETALAQADQDDLACTAVDHGRKRHGEYPGFGRHCHFDLGKHGGFEQQARIRQFHAHWHGTGLGFERRIDVTDGTCELLVGIGVDPDPGFGACFDGANVLLEHIGHHPDRGQV